MALRNPRRRGRRLAVQTCLWGLMLVAALAWCGFGYHADAEALSNGQHERRRTAATSALDKNGPPAAPAATSVKDDFPRALDKDKAWLVIFYILGIIYMFLCLAIVCDEFFVPAIMVICSDEYLNLSDDVAGATLMAAGGSAPELFTSYIGTFKETPVGFGTIVGSAVFNVLFVIGMCAVFALEPLRLTWWPLFRDCTYYTLTLVLLYVFFGVNTEKEIWFWEALILFLCYFGYCFLMKVHMMLYKKIMKWRFGQHWTLKEDSFANVRFQNPSTFRAGIVNLLTKNSDIAETAGIKAVTLLKGDLEQIFSQCDLDGNGVIDVEETREMLLKLNPGAVVDDKTVAAFMQEMQTLEKTSKRSVSMFNLKKGMSQSFMRPGLTHGTQVKPEAVNSRSTDELKEIEMAEEGTGPSIHALAGSTTNRTIDEHIGVTYNQFKHWYMASEQRLIDSVEKAWQRFDVNKDGQIDNEELQAMLIHLMGDQANQDLMRTIQETKADIIDDLDRAKDGFITKAEFVKWYRDSMFWTRAKEAQEAEEEASDPLELQCPDTSAPFRAVVFSILTLPIIVFLLLVIPDVRRVDEKLCGIPYKKWCFVSFVTSIASIGFFSYWMVDWAEVVGDTAGIPPAVMGLTFLAAGTSVPDLLSSVIVAQQGKGDMAVSSSIGSNIFDITVGLPLPWLSFCVIKSRDFVEVEAESLTFSLLMLIVMLIVVVAVIQASNWVMSKRLGFIMFFFYVIFVAQDLVANFYCSKPFLEGCK